MPAESVGTVAVAQIYEYGNCEIFKEFFVELRGPSVHAEKAENCPKTVMYACAVQVGKAMSSNETAAYKIMRTLDVDYVLVIFGGVIGYSGDDINKFLWMVRIAEGEHPKDIRVCCLLASCSAFFVPAVLIPASRCCINRVSNTPGNLLEISKIFWLTQNSCTSQCTSKKHLAVNQD